MKLYLYPEDKPFFNWRPGRIYILADKMLQRHRENIERLNDDPALTKNGAYHIEMVPIDRSKPSYPLEDLALQARQYLALFDIVAREVPKYVDEIPHYQMATLRDLSRFSDIKQKIKEFIDKQSEIDNDNMYRFRKVLLRHGKDVPEDKNFIDALGDEFLSAEKTDEAVRLVFSAQEPTSAMGSIEVRENEYGGYSVFIVLPSQCECQVTFNNADAEVFYVLLLLHPNDKIGLDNISTYRNELMALAKTLFNYLKSDENAARIADSICRPNMGDLKQRSIIQVQSAANNSVRQAVRNLWPGYENFEIVTSREESGTYRSIPLAATAKIPEELRRHIIKYTHDEGKGSFNTIFDE